MAYLTDPWFWLFMIAPNAPWLIWIAVELTARD